MKSISVGALKRAGGVSRTVGQKLVLILFCVICCCHVKMFTIGRSTKVHLYHCMKNCEQSPEKLRTSVLNIVNQYQVAYDYTNVLNNYSLFLIAQGIHINCNAESGCQKSGCVGLKVRLTHPGAIAAYTKKLQETLIYSKADSYCRVSHLYNSLSYYSLDLVVP